MIATIGIYFAAPIWLPACLLVIPIVWMGRRNLVALGRGRQWTATVLRCLVVVLLAVALAQPKFTRTNEQLTLITIIDRSRSIPTPVQQQAQAYLQEAFQARAHDDQLAVIDVAEQAAIAKLPSADAVVHERSTNLGGHESDLAAGLNMALAIAPPDSAVRIVLASDGNETRGRLLEAAQTAGANGIPIDVLPLQYDYDAEVIFKRLSVPATAAGRQTLPLRFILHSTKAASGRLQLNLNGQVVDLDPDSSESSIAVELKSGTNVKTLSLPSASRGIHEFEAYFIPEGPQADQIEENNRASAITYVHGPGHVLVCDADGRAGLAIANALKKTSMATNYAHISDFPANPTQLLDTDAIILANIDSSALTAEQQEMLTRYVNDLGGGLVMSGGPESFGAGGWIGSPVEDILPVDLDPPQKKQMPKGALVLIIDRSGSMVGDKIRMCKTAAIAAVKQLSYKDEVGIILFDARSQWLVKMTQATAENKEKIYKTISNVGADGGTMMGPAMEMAVEALRADNAGIKHVILLSDGQTGDPQLCADLGKKLAENKVTVSTVGVGEGANIDLMKFIAGVTKGRYYEAVKPTDIPRIFIKEAQVVRRALIVEKLFTPKMLFALHEVIRGVDTSLPPLNGYVLTGVRRDMAQTLITSSDGDPILATRQAGLGRCAALTTSADSRWAPQWIGWEGFDRFWEQLVRWTGKPTQPRDCEILTDVEGREVSIFMEATEEGDAPVAFSRIDAQIIAPDMSMFAAAMTQTGPKQYKGAFKASQAGSYVINLRYQKAGGDNEVQVVPTAVNVPFAPEFQDLTDNTAMLREISRLTRGRVLDTDPTRANMFSHEGVRYPKTYLPLTTPLLLIWLAVFLLDVAVRRIALDTQAIRHRVAVWFGRAQGATTQQAMLSRLQAVRRDVRSRLSRTTPSPLAQQHYEPESVPDEAPPLPLADVAPPVDAPCTSSQAPSAQPSVSGSAAAAEGDSHINRLLQAKRDAYKKK